jgi:hypothetical protein
VTVDPDTFRSLKPVFRLVVAVEPFERPTRLLDLGPQPVGDRRPRVGGGTRLHGIQLATKPLNLTVFLHGKGGQYDSDHDKNSHSHGAKSYQGSSHGQKS